MTLTTESLEVEEQEAKYSFLMQVLQAVADSDSDPEVVFPLLQNNVDKLDQDLIKVFQNWASSIFGNIETKQAQSIAAIFNNFGNLICQFPVGTKAINLELAIAAYTAALQVYTREHFPIDWAMIQNNLGIAYSKRIRGDRADNLERAIAAYTAALQVYTREQFPEQWAATQNNLGNAYKNRIWGERAENLELAIAAYTAALQIYTREHFPMQWATTQNNLGTAYAERIRGERAENLELAISAYTAALQVRTREHFPVQWATTQNNLGTAYADRIRGERAENLEMAIAAYTVALQVRNREQFPIDWATTQGNLAAALIGRAELLNSEADLGTAITYLQAALEVSPPSSSFFINDQYRLGNALSCRYQNQQNPADLRQAIQAYQIALEALSPEHYDRQSMWKVLPETQSLLGSRLVRDGQWQEGLQLLLNSLNQLSQGADPLAHANALFQTGNAYETLADWDNARLYYRDALRLYQHLEDQPGIVRSRSGLGSVLVSQGCLEKGMAELAAAREGYEQLQQSEKAAEIDNLYQAAQRAMARQTSEVYS